MASGAPPVRFEKVGDGRRVDAVHIVLDALDVGVRREGLHLAGTEAGSRNGIEQQALGGLSGLDGAFPLQSEIRKASRGSVNAPEGTGQLGSQPGRGGLSDVLIRNSQREIPSKRRQVSRVPWINDMADYSYRSVAQTAWPARQARVRQGR
jgi:hypothetical protein